METKTIERRAIVEIRANENDRKISGTAIVFNKESQLLGGWFTEIIEPGAATRALIDSSDIVMLWNHNDGMIPLARSKNGKGSLAISIDAVGVNFEFEARQTPQGDEILAAVRAGDVDACSFAFRVAEDGEEWMSKPDGDYLRTIKKFESLHDFSLVNEPAYLETSCRSLDKVKEELEKRNNPPEPPAPPAPPAPPEPPAPPAPPAFNAEEYYAPFDETITKFKTS